MVFTILYGFAGIVLAFTHADHALDIDVHDTYYVVNFLHLSLLFAIYQLIPTVAYYLLWRKGKRTNRALTVLHLLISTALPLLLIYILSTPLGPNRYYGDQDTAFFLMNNLFAILFIAGPIVLVLNILVSVLNKK